MILKYFILVFLLGNSLASCESDGEGNEQVVDASAGEAPQSVTEASGVVTCDSCSATIQASGGGINILIDLQRGADPIAVYVDEVACLSFEVLEALSIACELPPLGPGVHDIRVEYEDPIQDILIPNAYTVDFTDEFFLSSQNPASIYESSDSTLGDDESTLDSTTYNETNPYTAKVLTLESDISWSTSGKSALFLRADVLRVPESTTVKLSANGETSATQGVGGDGASGGGATGGSNNFVPAAFVGRDGGSGTDGTAHIVQLGGTGFAYTSPSNYAFGSGGKGGDGGDNSFGPGIGGAGGTLFGGGGGGGSGIQGGGGGGGGGGAGLIVILAHSLDIQGSLTIEAIGGNGQEAPAASVGSGGGGGGGVVWIALHSYNADLDGKVDVSGGTATSAVGSVGENGDAGEIHIFQINNDGTLTEKALSDSW